MNFSEAAENRALISRVASLENAIKELTRRVDELSAAERKRTERETPKKASNG